MAQSKEILYTPADFRYHIITPNDPIYPTLVILFEDTEADAWGADSATH